jgi:CheY-like chemotaxis protein
MSTNTATIVIADDDPLVRSAYKAALERRGHEVLLAEDGVRALALVESQNVGIVLLDILMPRKEGLETLIELKRRFPEVAVFAMSSGANRGNADFLSIATKFGADGVLKKPFQPQALFDLIDHRTPNVRHSANR